MSVVFGIATRSTKELPTRSARDAERTPGASIGALLVGVLSMACGFCSTGAETATLFPSAEYRFAAEVAASATLADVKPGRPPLNRLLVDVRLENRGAGPRWVLIPTDLPSPTAPVGVYELEQRTAHAPGGPVVIGRLAGGAGSYALELAPGAQVTIHALEIRWWRPLPYVPSQVALEVRFARSVSIGDEDIAGWFDDDPMIRASAEIDFPTAEPTHNRGSNDGRELPLSAAEVTAVVVEIAVP